MDKPIISSVIALALMGCGGGESGGGGSTPVPVKYFTVSFFDLDSVTTNQQTNCQIFGYSADETQKVIAFASQPDSNYQIIVHEADGKVKQKYNNLSSTSLKFNQNDIPDDGYISFTEFNSSGSSHVTTFAKNNLPTSINVYAKGKTNNNCLSSNISENPKLEKITGYIIPTRGNPIDYTGFNTAYQSLNNLTNQYKKNHHSHNSIEFHSQSRPFLAISYEADQDESEHLQPIGFEFVRYSKTIGSSSSPINLNETIHRDSSWNIPDFLNLNSAMLFIDGKQAPFNAPYAYLWQPLTTQQDGKFSYSTEIADENYYLNIQGKQNIINNQSIWGIKHVAQGTINQGASLTMDNVLIDFPDPEQPQLVTCSFNSSKQCIQLSTTPSLSNLNQRIFINYSIENSNQMIRQVIYAQNQAEIPVMMFDRSTDGKMAQLKNSFVSLLQTKSSEIIDSFYYQHQDLYDLASSFDKLDDPTVDFIPLLKNIAAQQDQQDVLKRQPYTWVWLEQGDN